MKVIRYLLIATVALILLAVAALSIAMLVIDPNTYKPQIEQVVKKQTHLELVLDGDISWSFIPIGLELNNVEATLDGERFVALKRLVAEIDFGSLLAMAPQVNNFVLEGLDAHLSVNKKGEANWTRIMRQTDTPQTVANQPSSTTTTEPLAKTSASEETATPLNFNVSNVEIGNAQVHYSDASSGQVITLQDFTLAASDISLGAEFPLNIRFRVETAEPQIRVNGDVAVRLSANQTLSAFSAQGLEARFDISGEALSGKTVVAKINGALQGNLDQQTAHLNNMQLDVANLSAITNLNVQGFGDQPKLAGTITVNPFSLKKLLNNLGQPAIETSDDKVFSALAFSTKVAGPAGQVELTDLLLQLDDTTFNGFGRYNLTSSALNFRLTGDELNADRYLPPAPAETQTKAQAPAVASVSSSAPVPADPNAQLLPLEALRALLLDVELGLNKLTVSNLQVAALKARVVAKEGLLTIDPFSGQLYNGSFNASASIDARTDHPQWLISTAVEGVQTLPLLTELAQIDMLSGAANLNINAKTAGNTLAALGTKAAGKITFNLAEGEFRSINLTRMACQGIALVNQQSLTATEWGTTTAFDDMRGTLVIDGNTLSNTELLASLAGMRLEGQGSVDMQQTLLDYELGLRIVGDVHSDPACRVTDTVKNVVIPVECRGSLSDDPGKLCSFDGSRFRDNLKDIAKNAAKAKINKELERATSKAEGRLRETLQKKMRGKNNAGKEEEKHSQEGDKLKETLKGLFK